MKSPLQLITGIRFQLDQLNASNAHHEFEHACRHLARATVTANLLPATGPVSGGGDQARDFETFTTFVDKTSEGSYLFRGTGESKPLVFACSLQRSNIESKIKSDVNDIVAGGMPYIIYFYSNQNVGVALRHRLQKWCKETYAVRLEIFDAQAIAEQLASASLFWIAEEYLRVPAGLFPKFDADESDPYEKDRRRWFSASATVYNYSDFVEVKFGLRRATFKESCKSDLKQWIALMEQFLTDAMPDELNRRAAYEICVATLRGMNNLNSRSELVDQYFLRWAQATEGAPLQDATVLLSYCTTAHLRGDFQIDPRTLHEWSKRLAIDVDREIARSKGPNTLAELLEIRAHVCQLAFLRGMNPETDVDETFKWWGKLITVAKNATLYPIENFADTLTALAIHLGEDKRYIALVGRVEKILQERSKGYVVAEKSRDRAVELLKSGKILAGIDQLHRARVRWFTGDTLKGSLLALLTLSEAYASIGLVYAAKYHALGAVFLAAKSSDEAVTKYLAEALHSYGLVQYAAGEFMGMSESFALYLRAHYMHASEPDDWKEHENVQAGLVHFLIARSWARSLGGSDVAAKFEESLRQINMPESMREEILAPELPLEIYENMSVEKIAEAASNEFWGVPFSDCGAIRTYEWRALGINWEASCANDSDDVPFVEQFVAVLQIAIAELARSEMCLLPTKVELRISTSLSDGPMIEPVSTNTRIIFDVKLRRYESVGTNSVQETETHVLALASAIFIACSAMPDSEVLKVIKSAFKNELPARAFLVRPYWELWQELAQLEGCQNKFTKDVSGKVKEKFELREHAELRWPDGPGPGYSKAIAVEYLTNRYRRAIKPVRNSLLRYRKSQRFEQWISKLRADSMLDWQILNLIANTVVDYRIKTQLDDLEMDAYMAATMAAMSKEEDESDLQMPEEVLYGEHMTAQLKIAPVTAARTWGLTVRQQTPNFIAFRKLLDVRYFQATDDIPHDDLFSYIP